MQSHPDTARRTPSEPLIPALRSFDLLKGQTALVTGTNSGVGCAIVVALGGGAGVSSFFGPAT